MTLFFLAVGLEAKRERDLGELREGRRLTVPVLAAILALANAGLHIDRDLLASAVTSPIAWGIVLAYVMGKPLGIVIASCAASRGMSRLAPVLAVAALAPLRRRDSAAGVRRGHRLLAPTPCPAQ